MVTIITPRTNGKPGLVELRVDNVHMGTICGTVSEICIQPNVNQFMVVVETGHTVSYLWADAVQQDDG